MFDICDGAYKKNWLSIHDLRAHRGNWFSIQLCFVVSFFCFKQSLSTDGRLIAGRSQNLQDPRRGRKKSSEIWKFRTFENLGLVSGWKLCNQICFFCVFFQRFFVSWCREKVQEGLYIPRERFCNQGINMKFLNFWFSKHRYERVAFVGVDHLAWGKEDHPSSPIH